MGVGCRHRGNRTSRRGWKHRAVRPSDSPETRPRHRRVDRLLRLDFQHSFNNNLEQNVILITWLAFGSPTLPHMELTHQPPPAFRPVCALYRRVRGCWQSHRHMPDDDPNLDSYSSSAPLVAGLFVWQVMPASNLGPVRTPIRLATFPSPDHCGRGIELRRFALFLPQLLPIQCEWCATPYPLCESGEKSYVYPSHNY